MRLLLSNIRLPLSYTEEDLFRAAAQKAGCRREDVLSANFSRRSLDARKKQDIHFTAQLRVEIAGQAAARVLKRKDADIRREEPAGEEPLAVRKEMPKGRIIVVGLGPAGLFAARELAAYGFHPLVIERGRPMDRRVSDLNGYWETGRLDPESNIMFGEGGAGTFSDGKLTSRSKDPRSEKVLQGLVSAGAKESILYDAKPHIGTDRLRDIVRTLREEIETLGGEVRFSACLTDIRTADGRLTAAVIRTPGGEETVPCENLILAIGQGARDTVRVLYGRGIRMEKKPFALGVRAEHPQKMIDRAQFGDMCGHPALEAAEYRITAKAGDRGVYSFCMCPGGTVVASASGEKQVVVNGMSYAARDGVNANSALVVQVEPEDMPEGDLGGILFCEEIERKAYLAGGSDGRAPAETLGDFLKREKAPKGFGAVTPTYRPGVVPADLWQILPSFAAEALAEALPVFGRQIEGFDREDAVLTAVESRTSAPYRILRGKDLQSVSLKGLFPVGEGAGYAGGIVSSAIDGLRAAEQIITGSGEGE